MAQLSHFATPANLPEPDQAGVEDWSARVEGFVSAFDGQFDHFFDPTELDTPAETLSPTIAWSAFPARLSALPEEVRWARADADRAEQDEYCEWSVEREGDEITRVTFTTEVPEYFEHLAERDRVEGSSRLLDFYRTFVDPNTNIDQLLTPTGRYEKKNPLNVSTQGRLAHLVQTNNNLFAAIALAAEATVLRQRNGLPVTTQQALVDCARLGNPLRHSDPQIAGAVNNAVSTGARISLADPLGLYIDRLLMTEMVAPDPEADVTEFWHIERGTNERILRASFSVPEERGFTVSNIELAGRPIRFGAQLAERISVKIMPLIVPGAGVPARQDCVAL